MTSINNLIVSGKKATRDGFGVGLLEAGRANKDVLALTADLLGSLKMDEFKKEFPERFFQMGIAEANMMGVAAGMATWEKFHSLVRLQIFLPEEFMIKSVNPLPYSHKNVKICASHAGLTLGEDGATHQILEDIGMMRMLPGMTVVVPCDADQTKLATLAIAEHYGPVYLRFGRPAWPIFTEGLPFEIGKAQILNEGSDVSLISTVI
jgi:transketolase